MKTSEIERLLGVDLSAPRCLLDQRAKSTSGMTYLYYRCIDLSIDFHSYDQSALFLPRGACVIEVQVAGSKNIFKVDSRHAIWIPGGLVHARTTASSIYDMFSLYPKKHLLIQFELNEVSRCKLFRKSSRLTYLVDEYYYDCVVRDMNEPDLKVFEQKIMEEVRIGISGNVPRERDNTEPSQQDEPFQRCLTFMETHLFEPLDLETIAKYAGMSVSTLLRAFRKALKTTPHVYLKSRRLDEARKLLETGKYPVTEVGVLVGYENLSAFSTAFRKRFGKPPSSLL